MKSRELINKVTKYLLYNETYTNMNPAFKRYSSSLDIYRSSSLWPFFIYRKSIIISRVKIFNSFVTISKIAKPRGKTKVTI